MHPPRRTIVLCIPLAFLAASCGHPPAQAAAGTPADRFSVPTPRDPYADDLARFLAGLPGREASPFHDLEARPAWIKHRRELDRAWNHLEGASLPAMRIFQKQELCARRIPKAPVFYPFSGPDALMETIFFPENPTYIM